MKTERRAMSYSSSVPRKDLAQYLNKDSYQVSACMEWMSTNKWNKCSDTAVAFPGNMVHALHVED